MSPNPSLQHRLKRALLCLLMLSAVVMAGCASAVDQTARTLSGEEDWRPVAPEQESYRIRVADGFQAPHPFRFEGPFASLYLSGFPVSATTGGLSATHILHDVADNARVAPSDPAAATQDPTVRGDLEAERDVLFIGEAQGHIAHDGRQTNIDGERLYITAPQGGLVIAGELALEVRSPISMDREGAHLTFAGYPFPVHGATSDLPPDLAATPQGGARIEDVRIRWGGDGNGSYAHDVNGSLVLDDGARIVLGAPAFSFVPETFEVGPPDTQTSAWGGHRSRDPVGFLSLGTEAGLFHLRDQTATFDRLAVEVRGLERFDYDATATTLSVEGTADQVLEGTRPWFQSEIAIDHPSQVDPRTVTLRVPPGNTFRTMLGVREVSDVGTAVDVLPTTGRNDGDIVVTLGNRWEDERVLDDTLTRAMIDMASAFVWIPDGQVRLGPEAIAYLPVSFEVPAGLEEPAEVELILHARNAAVVHMVFVLEPDADAATSDVSSKTPMPVWLALVALGAVASVLRRKQG